MAWTVVDYTNGKNAGYLQLTRDGERVAQFFPYAKDTNELRVRENAEYIALKLNEAEAQQRS